MVSGRRSGDDPGRFGLDETGTLLARLVGAVLPGWATRRGVAVTVSTDRSRYEVGEPVVIDIEFSNRFPFPITVQTPRRRLWGWTVDGLEAASDERAYLPERPGRLTFEARERKRVRRRWDGRFKRTSDGRTRWEQAVPGEYEIRGYVALPGRDTPADSTTVVIKE